MKKILTFLLIIVALFSLAACNINITITNPEYSNTYSFNDNLHWKNQLNGTGRTDVGEHVNDRGKCSVCDYYFDASEFLSYVKVNYDGNVYYAVQAYTGKGVHSYVNVEIPAYYQGPNDSSPIQVIAINAYTFAPSKNDGIEHIKSIKLNEGLKFIGNGAFSGTLIEEVVVPNSVTGGINGISNVTFDEEGNQLTNGRFTYWPSSSQGLYNTFGGCLKLKRAVIGNNVTRLEGHIFSSCSALEEVVVGDRVGKIGTRAFYCCPSLKYVILPAHLESITESHIQSQGKYVSLYNIFEGSKGYPEIFFKMTREKYKSIPKIKLVQRDYLTGIPLDENGNLVDLNTYTFRSDGLVEGWCGMADLYFEGEWYFDENGDPTPYVKQ